MGANLVVCFRAESVCSPRPPAEKAAGTFTFVLAAETCVKPLLVRVIIPAPAVKFPVASNAEGAIIEGEHGAIDVYRGPCAHLVGTLHVCKRPALGVGDIGASIALLMCHVSSITPTECILFGGLPYLERIGIGLWTSDIVTFLVRRGHYKNAEECQEQCQYV
jgi:hypothetical protein